MFSFAVFSHRPYLIDAVGRWRGACGDMAAIAHRMRELLACYLFLHLLVPQPGVGGLFEACGRWGVGGEGVGR